MKPVVRILCGILLFSTVCIRAQVSKPQPDLRTFTSEQLRDCYDDFKICGARDDSDIEAELASRISQFSVDELVSCFDDFEFCGLPETEHDWTLSDEIARRGDPHNLLLRYWHEPRKFIRNGIEHVAYHFDTPEVTPFMERVEAERITRKDDQYWAVNYLAKKCHPAGLKLLTTGRYRRLGSLQYQTSVELFGKCLYRPAIPYLVDTAVYDWSFNISIAADHSLHALYPDAPKNFDRLEQMQHYFCARAKNEGFKVRCKTK